MILARKRLVLFAIVLLAGPVTPGNGRGAVDESPGQTFHLQSTPASLARWMYPFNGNPAGRPTASVFGSLGSTPHFDSRDAQFLLGWNTAQRIPAGLGPTNYLVRRARVTLTIASGDQYIYTGTLRDYRSYFPTNDPRHVAPPSGAMPVELHGGGYRGGYTSATFPQDGPWGVAPGRYFTNRTVYAAGYNRNGILVDVSNNVGDDGTNEISDPFEIAPFAVGRATGVAEGQRMPAGSRLTFELNLADPLIHGYLQQGLNGGTLVFVVTSLAGASLAGPPSYPSFHTIFSAIASPDEYPILDLEGTVIRTGVDQDSDGLPDDWEHFHFATLGQRDTEDVDGDGLDNRAEYQAGTCPNSGADTLRLSSIARTGTTTEVRFTAAPGRRYSIEWSDDLKYWHAVPAPEILFSSPWLAKSEPNPVYPSPVHAAWRDASATHPQRAYRVRLP